MSEREKQYFRYYGYVAVGLAGLAGIVLGFRESVEDILLTESGLIERASALGYFACAAYMLAKGGSEFVRTRGYFVVLVTLFGCRELDFDKAFTTIGILKSRFFVSPDVPLGEKLAGFVVISILIWSVYKILSKHLAPFLSNLREKTPEAIGVAVVFFLLAFSKSIDGLPRKLQPLGIEVSAEINAFFGALEEVLELGIPIYIALVAHAWFNKQAAK